MKDFNKVSGINLHNKLFPRLIQEYSEFANRAKSATSPFSDQGLKKETNNKTGRQTGQPRNSSTRKVRRRIPRPRGRRGRAAWISIVRRYRAKRRHLKRRKRVKRTPEQIKQFAYSIQRIRGMVRPDPYYKSRSITLLTNRILKSGKN